MPGVDVSDLGQGPGEPTSGGGQAGDGLVPWMAQDEHVELCARREAARSPRHRRRRSVFSRTMSMALVAAAAASGMATAGSATGSQIVDRLLRGGLAAAVAAAAAWSPTWAVVVLSTGAAALGWTAGPIAGAAGAGALLLASILAATEHVDRRLLKAASGALSATALLRVPGGPVGATAAATAAFALLIVVTGIRRGPRRWRRPVTLVAVGALGLAAVGTALGALAGLQARAAFEGSAGATTTALASAQSGRTSEAAASARSAAVDLRAASASLEVWWARPAWLLPIVGAHLRAGDEVARSAGPAVEAAAGSAEALRLDELRPEAGRLDLDRLAAAEPELAKLSGALHAAQRGARRARSPWLLEPLQTRLEAYDAELGSVTTTSDRALLAVRALPRVLGAERPTRWFIAVANPAETRELGGCVCDYAVVSIDRGAMHLDRAGTVSDIGAYQTGRNLDGVDLPQRFVGQHPEVFWQNLGGYPDLPTVAAAARTIWDQVAPGAPIDGVAYVDPHGLAALLRLTGPVAAPAPLGTLTAENAAPLLIEDQYARFSATDQRKDALHNAAAAAFTALAAAPLPAPADIGAALGPAVRGGHLTATAFDPLSQRLFDEVGASGRLPGANGGDLASLRTSNLLENKLDAYLRRSVRYEAVVDPRARRVQATATIELRNEATSGLPDYVAANRRGLPRGTNLVEVAWYSGLGLESVEVDGRPVPATSSFARGWWTHSVPVTVPPGRVVTIVVRLTGRMAATSPYRLAVSPQASARDDLYFVDVKGAAGWSATAVPRVSPGRRTDLVVPLHRR